MDFYKIYTSDNNSNICFQCDEIDYDMSLQILYGKVDNSNRIFQFSYYGGKISPTFCVPMDSYI
ncbi:MAG: hypothetical protein IPI99_01275 [Saprospiraceae bacterium]|nr:hypothetical protein [Saprospiraceae bacterium]